MCRLPLLVSLVMAFATTAHAVTRCKGHLQRDGTIEVTAADVVGSPRWGLRYGAETNAFDDTADCLAGGRMRGCALAPGPTPAPASCTLYVRDDGPAGCSTYLKRCLPGAEPPPCALLPPGNIWNRDISAMPVHPMSDAWVASIGADRPLHPDFGSGRYRGGAIGIPYVVIGPAQPLVPIPFTYADESDPGPYPIPELVPIEGGGSRPSVGKGDAHVLLLQAGTCRLYEVFAARFRKSQGGWSGGSGATYDLGSNTLRPAGWTSADAAGLPIVPGLVRYDEIVSGAITHAVRFASDVTQRAYVWPARHFASPNEDANLPPMGIRVRLKADVDISGFSPTNRIILTALQHYGMMLADNGGSWFITGAPDARWDNEDLHALTTLHGSDFEVVDVSSLMIDPDSGATLP